MDKQLAAQAILLHTAPLIPFDGWNQHTLNRGALLAGYKKTDVIRVFPGGTMQAVDVFLRQFDDAFLKAMEGYYLDTMKIRERIRVAVKLRITLMESNKEAVRSATALQALPFYAYKALTNLYRTVDTIWFAIGDTSTDFNFYTKRLTLAAVYSATILYWLNDNSAGQEQTWLFLERRIDDVMKIEKAKHYARTHWFPDGRQRA